jgi:hypothetical protein
VDRRSRVKWTGGPSERHPEQAALHSRSRQPPVRIAPLPDRRDRDVCHTQIVPSVTHFALALRDH